MRRLKGWSLACGGDKLCARKLYTAWPFYTPYDMTSFSTLVHQSVRM